VIFLVQLNKLKGSTSAIAFFFGKTIPLVKTAFAMLSVVSGFFMISTLTNTFFWIAMALGVSYKRVDEVLQNFLHLHRQSDEKY
jgi:hypothetical protein